MPSRIPTLLLALVFALFAGGADGCSSDPNVEGAKLDLRNGDYERALENVDEALATNPDNVEALQLRVEILRQQYENTPGAQPKAAFLAANFDDMVSTAERAASLAPDDPTNETVNLSLWVLAINAGNELIRDPQADVADAIGYFQRSTQLVPDSSQGYLGLGLANLRTGDAAQALAPLERGVEVAPDDPILAYYYGRALVLSDRPSDAVTFLEGAQSRFPEDEDVQTMLLNAYTLAGQTDQAIDRYAAVVEQQPTNPTYRYNYGALLLQAERYDEAVEQLTEATRLAPDNSDAFYNLGAAFQNRAAALNEQYIADPEADGADALIEQRNENLEMSVAPLMQARTLSAGTEDEAGVCDALFRVYTQLNRVDEAQAVSECAGISMN